MSFGLQFAKVRCGPCVSLTFNKFCAGKYRDKLSFTHLYSPSIYMISTVMGEEVSYEVTEVGYWLDHIVRPVRYRQAIERAFELGATSFVEVGPDNTLTRLASSAASDFGIKSIQFAHGTSKQEVASIARFPLRHETHRMLQKVAGDLNFKTMKFGAYLHAGIVKNYLDSYTLHGSFVVPNTAFFEMFISAGTRWASSIHTKISSLRDVIFYDDVVISSSIESTEFRPKYVQCRIEGTGSLELLSVSAEDSSISERLANAVVVTQCVTQGPDWFSFDRYYVANSGRMVASSEDVSQLYDNFASNGLVYGPSWKIIEKIARGRSANEIISKLNLPKSYVRSQSLIPAPLMDAIFQSAGRLLKEVSSFWLRSENTLRKMLSARMLLES